MNPPSIDIVTLLTDSTVGLTYGTDLFVSEIPETVAGQCACIYDTGGFENVHSSSSAALRMPSVQVMVRGNRGDYEGAMALAQSIHDALDGINGQVINGTTYVLILAVSEPSHIGGTNRPYDESDRPLVTTNFNIHRTTAA